MIVVKDATQGLLQQAAQVQLGSEVSGVVGLGTNRVASRAANGSWAPTFEDSVIGQWFLTFPDRDLFTFAVAIGSPLIQAHQNDSPLPTVPEAAAADAGILHLLQPDPSYYNPDHVSWITTNITTGTDSGDIPASDWSVVLDGWVAHTNNDQMSSQGKIVADFDPMYTNLYIPQDQAALIRKHTRVPLFCMTIG